MPLTLNPIPRDSGDLYRYGNGIIEAWTGVAAKGIALTNVQVNDTNRYAIDAQNLDATGTPSLKALRATAGGHSLRVDSDGVILSSASITTLAVTGNATVTGTLGAGATTVASLLSSSSVAITTTLNVGGVSTMGTINAGPISGTTGAFSSTLGVTGAATLAATSVTTLTVSSTLGVTGTSTLGVLNAGATQVTTLAASSTLNVTGVSTVAALAAQAITCTTLTAGSTLTAQANFAHTGANVGFFNSAVNAKQTVSGSRGGNAALASLCSALANYGLITDSTS
jgi:hypothetical protein